MPPRSDKRSSSAANLQSLLTEHESLTSLVEAQNKEIEQLKTLNEQLKVFAPLLELKQTLAYVREQLQWRGEFPISPFGRGHFCIRGSLGWPQLIGVFPELNDRVDFTKMGLGREFELEHRDHHKTFWSAWELGQTMLSEMRGKVNGLRDALIPLKQFLALTAEEVKQIGPAE